MKITAIEPFVCDGGLRQFGFLKVTTDEGIVGWSEIYDFTAVASLATAIRIIGREFIGLGSVPHRVVQRAHVVPRAAGDHRSGSRSSPRSTSRSGTSRARRSACPSTSCSAASSTTGCRCTGATSRPIAARGRRSSASQPQTTYAEWAAGARDVVAQGYKVLKTNLIQAQRGTTASRGSPTIATAGSRRDTLDEAVEWIGTIRDVVGPDIGISVDVQFEYRMGGIVQLARAMEPFNLYWLEVEDLDAGRPAGGPAPDDDAVLPRRIALPARPVPAVLPEPRDRHRDDRDALERRLGDAPHRRDGASCTTSWSAPTTG